MLKVAILDDYQNVTHHFANWETLGKKIELNVFNEYIGVLLEKRRCSLMK